MNSRMASMVTESADDSSRAAIRRWERSGAPAKARYSAFVSPPKLLIHERFRRQRGPLYFDSRPRFL